MKFLAIFALFIATVWGEPARFDNYRVYSVTIENEKQLEAFKYLEEKSDSYTFFDPIHFGEIEVLVPPHQRSHFYEISDTLGFQFKLLVENYQTLIDNENPPRTSRTLTWDAYYTVDQIHAWIDGLPAAHPGKGVTVENIGTTVQGRPIKLVSIAANPANREIIIEANIHAREWISHATTTWIINELLTSTDPFVVNMRQTINWRFVPMMNPDGFEFSRTNNRNWRKNRNSASALCFGIDGNRNFGYNWLQPDENNNLGASTSPCSDTFAGPAPFSERETATLNDVVFARYANRTDIFLSMHAYGHYLLHGWGTTRTAPPNLSALTTVGNAMVDAIRVRDNITYRLGSTISVLYAASGSSPDHATGAYGIPLSYTYEMRGNGAYGNFGFVLPAEFIIPNSLEVWDGFKAMVTSARSLGYL